MAGRIARTVVPTVEARMAKIKILNPFWLRRKQRKASTSRDSTTPQKKSVSVGNEVGCPELSRTWIIRNPNKPKIPTTSDQTKPNIANLVDLDPALMAKGCYHRVACFEGLAFFSLAARPNS